MLSLSLSSCSSPSKKEESTPQVSGLKELTCYVSWSNPEYRDRYLSGLGMDKDERSRRNLDIPIWQNDAFLITNVTDKTVSVLFDFSDKNGVKYLGDIMDKNFDLEGYEFSEELIVDIKSFPIIIDKKELSALIKDKKYEQVQCLEFKEAQNPHSPAKYEE